MVDTRKIGRHIAKLRKECGMTGEKFAEYLDVSPQAVSKWETGKNLPETALLPAISKLLGVSIDSILFPDAYAVKSHLGGHYIDKLPVLRWGESRDCTWAGSIQLLLKAMGIDVTYSEIMGFSGACYYLAMTTDWCPSSSMLQIAYDPAHTLEQALGVERGDLGSEDLDGKVKAAISRGLPVMLIEPRVEMEWGVLCGYTGEGQFYGRSYFDYLLPDERDIFTDNRYFLADRYPGAAPSLIYFGTNKGTPISLDTALRGSLETAKYLYTAEPRDNGRYIIGLAAYDIYINALQLNDADFAAVTPYGATGNGILLLTRLIDARHAAHEFWAEKSKYLSKENARKMQHVAELYAKVVSTLRVVLPRDAASSTQNGYPYEAWTSEMRSRISEALTSCKYLEQQVLDMITDVLDHW